ncbi:MAG: M18 family aminopeptidase [Clostridia bacterium]|nr:M18 family aminopeptidase [Clostridia bacterium]
MMNESLLTYISACPTAYQAVEHTAEILEAAGYQHLREGCLSSLAAGRGYYVTRNGSSLIAFRTPSSTDFRGFMITAAHDDSPCFKIKENAELCDGRTLRLAVEKYGGMLCATWMDRPLAVAGRVTVRTSGGISVRPVVLSDTTGIIPSVAIHMNRNANDGASYNPAVDMLPLMGEASDAGLLRRRLAEALNVAEADILTTDLFLYNPQPGMEWSGYISAPRLDDLQCAYASLSAFLTAGEASAIPDTVPVFCLFDNEEVGSQTKQGAASTFLFDTLTGICEAVGLSHAGMIGKLSSSFMVSCDNAHAVHPNHPEYRDPNHAVYMNGGVVIKYNANQRYTSDAVSAGLFALICERAGVPIQYYANRADMMGGSTLGNIANTQVSLNTVDIGLPQLAMHSSFETAGAKDTAYLVNALTTFFSTELLDCGEGEYRLTEPRTVRGED